MHDRCVIDHRTAGSTGLVLSGGGDIWQSTPLLLQNFLILFLLSLFHAPSCFYGVDTAHLRDVFNAIAPHTPDATCLDISMIVSWESRPISIGRSSAT